MNYVSPKMYSLQNSHNLLKNIEKKTYLNTLDTILTIIFDDTLLSLLTLILKITH